MVWVICRTPPVASDDEDAEPLLVPVLSREIICILIESGVMGVLGSYVFAGSLTIKL